MHNTKIIAHRGASKEAPENTLASIKKAIDLNFDYIDLEIDVHLSSDHVPVVMHDHTVERTTSLKSDRKITEMTLAEIKQLDAGSWHHEDFKGEPVPTLQEVLALDFNKCGLMIELKASPFSPHQVATKIMEVIDASNPPKRLIFGSFEPALLKAIRMINPKMELIYIVEEKELIHSFDCKYVAVCEKLLNPALIKELLERKKVIWSFTVDCPERAVELRASGIHGIITNNPREIKKIIKD